jgi:3-dehydroquinate synthase
MQYSFSFPSGHVQYFFGEDTGQLHKIARPDTTILITDEHVADVLPEAYSRYRKVVIPPGEETKSLQHLATLTEALMKEEAHRATKLLGVGGGVVTDITGMLASVYMRGIPFGFVPTSLLGMVDASIGGKNGVNHAGQKNMLGTFRQPEFVWYDTVFLRTLPPEEWSNGFAEIIKYGCIADARILTTLQDSDVAFYQQHPEQLADLIQSCADVKNKIVHADEQESGLRAILNFGHTAGHAFESIYGLSHGAAVGLGMIVASHLSVKHDGLAPEFPEQLRGLLTRMGLPVTLDFSVDDVMTAVRLDKKRDEEGVKFVLIQQPGVAQVKPLSFDQIREGLQAFRDECGH